MSGRKRASRPFARFSTALAAAALLLCALALLSCRIDPPPGQEEPYRLRIVMLDVGQGDSILLSSGGRHMLVDAGENGEGGTVVSDLRGLGVEKLAAALGTHPHSDHIGGLDTVLKAFPVDALYLSPKKADTETYEDVLDAAEAKGLTVTMPKPGDRLTLGEADIEFLWPAEGYDSDDENNCSVVIRVTEGGYTALLCGDIEKDAENRLLDSGGDVRCDVLKVAHHGSDTSSGKAFLKAAAPRYALISVGKDNDYKHPDKDTLGRLVNAGAEIHRTDIEGTVTVYFRDDGISVVKSK